TVCGIIAISYVRTEKQAVIEERSSVRAEFANHRRSNSLDRGAETSASLGASAVAGTIAAVASPSVPAAREFNPTTMLTIAGATIAIAGWAFRGIFDKIALNCANPLDIM